MARDWKMGTDLPEYHQHGQYMLPHDIVVSPLKVDMYIASKLCKIAVFIQLTCPNDENILIRCMETPNKYAHLATTQNEAWTTYIFTLEVGAKGFINRGSFSTLTFNLGFDRKRANKLKSELSKMAVRCSYVIWINRYNKSMDFCRLKKCDIPDDMWYISRKSFLANDIALPMVSTNRTSTVKHYDCLQLLDTIRKIGKLFKDFRYDSSACYAGQPI